MMTQDTTAISPALATEHANKGFGVTVSLAGADGEARALVVVAADERDAELVACRIVGSDASAETFRELSAEEVLEYGLDLSEHGSAKALSVPRL